MTVAIANESFDGLEADSVCLARRVISRRRFAGIAFAGALAAGSALAIGRSALAQYDGQSRTTADVNLRGGAGTTFPVLAVVPAGSIVNVFGEPAFGFVPVKWNGLQGWVSGTYLVPANGGSPGNPAPDPNNAYTGSAGVPAATNLRAGSSTSTAVLTVVPAGATVSTSTQVVNGFRAVKYNGTAGWMIDGALVPGSGNPGTPPPAGGTPGYVNTAANFRMDPSYGNNVIRVLPAHTVVTITAEKSGEFVRVQTPGDIGWVYAAFVTAGAPPSGNPGTPPPTTGAKASATVALNLRAQASTGSQVLAVMPAGATIYVTGSASNGFTPVNYNGTNGWAASDYVKLSGGTPTPGAQKFVATAALNIRAQANANSALLGLVPAGATVTLSGSGSAGYLGIIYNGITGFVLASYLVQA